MSTLRQHPVWKRTAAVGVAIGLSAGAIGVAVGTGGSDASASTRQTDLVQPSFAGQAAGATPPSGDTGAVRPPGGGMGPDLAAAATALGSTESAVQQALSSGTSIAAQAESAGVGLDAVIAAMVAGETADVRAQVTAGTLTQDRADQIVAGIEERVTAFVNGEMPSGPPPGAQGTPPSGATAAPTASGTQGG